MAKEYGTKALGKGGREGVDGTAMADRGHSEKRFLIIWTNSRL